ncbi:MAG: TonB-dependent receptor [Bacteroidetes bacterium]|nr:TonB-dependent receptor [Bacteroidota bacterium]
MSSTVHAQNGAVEGSVRDDHGEALVGVTVQIDETRLGAVTRKDGSFLIENVPAGDRTLVARAVGYEMVRTRVPIRAGDRTHADVVLKESAVKMQGVEVRAEGKRQLQSDTRTSVTKIDPRDAKYLPGAGEDVMRSLRSLPGVVAPNDFSSQLVVRGSGPDQNLIVIDDIEVFNPYRLYGFVSMFNPETVSDITLLTGGFPAKYGDRLSAVLDVTNREGGGKGKLVTGKLNASMTNANLVLEGELPSALNGGWLLSGRRTYYDLILGPVARSAKLVDGDVAFPNFRDLQFKAVLSPWPTSSFVLDGITSRDATELISGSERTSVDSFSINDRSTNSLAGLSWRYTPNTNILSKTTGSWYENTGETEFGGEGGSRLLYGDASRDSVGAMIRALPQAVQDSLRKLGITAENPPALGISDGNAGFSFRKFTLRNETSIRSGAHLFEFGATLDEIHTAITFKSTPDSLLKAIRLATRRVAVPDSIVSSIDYYRTNAFAQDKINFSDRFYLQAGLRFDYYRLIDRSYLAPRLSASYAIDPLTTVRGAFGIYYQSPGYEKLLDRATYFDLTSPAVADLKAERATHYVLGIERILTEDWQVRVEGYYKDFADLIVQQKLTGVKYVSTPKSGESVRYPSGWTDPVAVAGDSLTPIPVNDATGAAYGVEVLLQKIGTPGTSRWSGWLGYTLSFANRYRDGITFPFDYDQRHTVNLVMNYRVNDWLELGSNFQFGSGFPYTPPVGFYPVVVMNTDSTGVKKPAIATNVFGETLFTIDRGGVANINSARLPAYHRLDVRATWYADWWDLKWSIYLDVINIYNHKNILSRSYTVDKTSGTLVEHDVGMLPILPTLGLSVAF